MEFKKIRLPFEIKRPVLALGSQTKNILCFAKGNFAYLSQVHSDLTKPEDLLNFERDLKYFLKKRPKIIAYDLHPEYQSSKYAYELRVMSHELRAIQHHHAHIASCMAENGLKNQKVIGIAFDGTGLGIDNTLWGAEFFVCDYKNFKRAAHLKEIPLLGGEKAILEPWRLGALWLYLIYAERFLDLNLSFVRGINRKKWQILKSLFLKKIYAPVASSMGRLFDAAGSLVLAKYKATFEAELAIELEKLAASYSYLGNRAGLRAKSYQFKIMQKEGGYIIDPQPIFKEIVLDLKRKEPKSKIAYKFHLSVAEMARQISLILRKATGINKIALSGGVFQNNLLLQLTLDLLYKESFQVFRHQDLSCNDSCISLGQAAISNYKF